MGRSKQSYRGVALTAPVTIPYVRKSDHSTARFMGLALGELLQSTGLAKNQVDGMSISTFTLAPDNAAALTEYFGVTLNWIDSPYLGGSSGVISAKRAARAIQNGDARFVACIAADNAKPQSFKTLVKNFSSFSRDSAYPYGAAGPNGVFSLLTRKYMETYGAEAEDFGRLCISQRQNASLNPNAMLTAELTMEEYLSARPIADPLKLLDCVMPCAGAEAYMVMSTEDAIALKLPYVEICSAEENHNAILEKDIPLRGGWDIFREDLYQAADCSPDDIDLLYTYDDYPVIVFHQFEGLGFCAPGQAANFVRETDLTIKPTGKSRHLPHNTSGGQLSAGQAGFAGGFLGMTEALRQLTHQAEGRQVDQARTALVSGFGMVNYDRGLCAAAIILKGVTS
ncbi:MAG: acetyl-CoA acetyltransferase [Alphaproteobacteria bacterium]|nr:MAG: acetyl-CoA acetyltransferase [Alphaproteobacteria bacterium]